MRGSPTPKASLTQVHDRISSGAAQVAGTIDELREQMKEVAHGIVRIKDLSAAQSEELGNVRTIVQNLQDVAEEDNAASFNRSQVYNDMAEEVNQENTQAVASVNTLNNADAQVNSVHESLDSKSSEMEQYEGNIAKELTSVQNRRNFLDHELQQMEKTVGTLDLWAHHATPVLNVQTDAILQLEGWINHLETQVITVNQMITRLSNDLDGEKPASLMKETESNELGQQGNPPAVPAADEAGNAESSATVVEQIKAQ